MKQKIITIASEKHANHYPAIVTLVNAIKTNNFMECKQLFKSHQLEPVDLFHSICCTTEDKQKREATPYQMAVWLDRKIMLEYFTILCMNGLIARDLPHALREMYRAILQHDISAIVKMIQDVKLDCVKEHQYYGVDFIKHTLFLQQAMLQKGVLLVSKRTHRALHCTPFVLAERAGAYVILDYLYREIVLKNPGFFNIWNMAIRCHQPSQVMETALDTVIQNIPVEQVEDFLQYSNPVHVCAESGNWTALLFFLQHPHFASRLIDDKKMLPSDYAKKFSSCEMTTVLQQHEKQHMKEKFSIKLKNNVTRSIFHAPREPRLDYNIGNKPPF